MSLGEYALGMNFQVPPRPTLEVSLAPCTNQLVVAKPTYGASGPSLTLGTNSSCTYSVFKQVGWRHKNGTDATHEGKPAKPPGQRTHARALVLVHTGSK